MKVCDQWIKSCRIEKGILNRILSGAVTSFLVSFTKAQNSRKLHKLLLMSSGKGMIQDSSEKKKKQGSF